MKAYLLCFAAVLITTSSVSQSKTHSNVIPLVSNHAAGFAPAGWKVIRTARGDLNGDRLPDLVIIIEKNDPENIKKNDGFGSSTLNLNPRTLIVALKTSTNYRRHTVNTQLIPSESSFDAPCLIDPLEESGGIEIQKQSLFLSLYYWLSCGSWEMGTNTMQFKLRQNQFKLIGSEHESIHRALGDISYMSVNYLTGKKKQTTGYHISGENEKPKVIWKKLPKRQLYDLSNVLYEQVTKDYQIIDDGS